MGEKSGLTRMYSMTPLMLMDVLKLAAGLLLVGAVLFLSAGRIGWVQGWTLLGVLFACVFVNLVILGFLNPGALVGGRTPGSAAAWDKALVTAAAILGLGALAVAGAQDRLGWTPHLPRWTMVAGLVAVVAGNILFVWAAAVNRFFTRWVCVRRDLGHEVAREGPYRIVRHPGYLGWILVSLGVPPALGAAWAWAPMGGVMALIVVRTMLEDDLLRQELPGYAEYCGKVPRRLIPGVW